MIVTDDKPSSFVPAVIVFAVFTVLFCLATIMLYVRIQMMTKNKKVDEDKPVETQGGEHVKLSGADNGRSIGDYGFPSETIEGVKSGINKSNKPDYNIANKAADIEKQEEEKEEEPAVDIRNEEEPAVDIRN
jgi:hypothetical protein